MECANNQVKGKNFYGSNVSLEDRIILNLFFTGMTEDMYAEITYTSYDGMNVSVTAEKISQYTASIYKIAVDQMVLADAFSPITVTVYNADGSVHGSATDSVESYVARIGKTAINEAIMKFAYSAKAYLG